MRQIRKLNQKTSFYPLHVEEEFATLIGVARVFPSQGVNSGEKMPMSSIEVKLIMSNEIEDVVMVDGVISIPAMTREDILERDWVHPEIGSIRTMLVCGNLVYTKVFPLLIHNQEEFISYMADQSLSHTIHYIGKWDYELRIVLSEPKDHTTNIDANVIEHLGKLFLNNDEFISYIAEKSLSHIIPLQRI